jgi:hypothetical protein
VACNTITLTHDHNLDGHLENVYGLTWNYISAENKLFEKNSNKIKISCWFGCRCIKNLTIETIVNGIGIVKAVSYQGTAKTVGLSVTNNTGLKSAKTLAIKVPLVYS